MAKKYKNPPWIISIIQKGKPIEEFEVPAHQMSERDVKRFLHAIIVRYKTDGPKDMLAYYLNDRPGELSRVPIGIHYGSNKERRLIGYSAADSDYCVSAMQDLGDEGIEAYEQILEESRRNTNG